MSNFCTRDRSTRNSHAYPYETRHNRLKTPLLATRSHNKFCRVAVRAGQRAVAFICGTPHIVCKSTVDYIQIFISFSVLKVYNVFCVCEYNFNGQPVLFFSLSFAGQIGGTPSLTLLQDQSFVFLIKTIRKRSIGVQRGSQVSPYNMPVWVRHHIYKRRLYAPEVLPLYLGRTDSVMFRRRLFGVLQTVLHPRTTFLRASTRPLHSRIRCPAVETSGCGNPKFRRRCPLCVPRAWFQKRNGLAVFDIRHSNIHHVLESHRAHSSV